MNKKRCLILGLFALMLIVGNAPFALSEGPSKKEVITRYEKAVDMAEEYGLYEEDVYRVLPKIKLAGTALYHEDFEKAAIVLDEIERGFELVQSTQSRKLIDREKMEWLEIYVDIFQRLLLLAFLALVFIKWRYLNRMFVSERFSLISKLYISLIMAAICSLISVMDLAKYGESTWAFFDLQLVLVTVSGLIGGLWSGLVTGLLAGGFRLLMRPDFFVYLMLALFAGAAAGLASKKLKNFRKSIKAYVGVTCLIALVQGFVLYWPTRELVPWNYFLFMLAIIVIISGAGAAIFFGVLSIILKEHDRQKIEKELLKTRLLFLQAQIRPHFLANTLTTVWSICHREKAPKAQELVTHLARFSSWSLEHQEELVELGEELDYMDNYIKIERIRFEDRLEITKTVKIQDKTRELKIPMLVIQPLAENAINHGMKNKLSGGFVNIDVREKDGELVIQVRDNGCGMKPGTFEGLLAGDESLVHGFGIGVRNIHERLVRWYGPNRGLRYDSVVDEGTTVTIRIPLDKLSPDDSLA